MKIQKMILNYQEKIENYNVDTNYYYSDYSYMIMMMGFFTKFFTSWVTIKNLINDYKNDRVPCYLYQKNGKETFKIK